MIRLLVLGFVLLAGAAQAEPHGALLPGVLLPAGGDGFDQALAAEVFTTALLFMAPRTLEAVSIPQLTLWSLRGLSAVDASLTSDLRGGQLVLAGPDRLLLALPPPGAEDAPGWGQAAAQLAASAWDASPGIRRAGTEGVIRNMFDELFNHLDPYSRYAGPEEARRERDHRSGAGGVGITPALRAGGVVIQAVAADSPAAEAGLRADLPLLAIDGRRIGGLAPSLVAARLAGEPDTTILLTVRQEGRIRTVALVRALVPEETVFSGRSGNVLTLRITGFTSDTDERVRQELARFLSAGHPAGIAVDLRGNRGGLLRQAVATATLLLGERLVATTVGRDPDADHIWQGEGEDLARGLPVVVVVDGRSASAAEVFAAALADDGRAVVLGSTTLGKGLVQTITALPDGGELLITWSRILAPLGWPIQGLGVLPQICTSLGEEALRRQMAALAAGQQPMQNALARHRAARAPMPLAKILDIRNTCPAAIGRDDDLATALSVVGSPAIYARALPVP